MLFLMPNETLQVRAAVIADCERLIPLINAAFAAAEPFMTGPRTDPDRLAKSMETGTILLSEDGDGKLAASVYVEVRGKRSYVGMLAVDRSRQKSGIGRWMMAEAESFLRGKGCEVVDITVLSLRPELPPLYRKLGFVETGTEEFHYPHPIAGGQECYCIVMTKEI
jgi:ribosomal protein S18 acetylase RimI-like enzyme